MFRKREIPVVAIVIGESEKELVEKKKLLCLPIIAVLMLNISVIDNNVSALSNPTVYATVHEFYTQSNITGTRFNVTIGIKNITDMGCWSFDLYWNNSLLEAEYIYATPDTADHHTWVPVDVNGTFHRDGPPAINNTLGRVWAGALVHGIPPGPGMTGDFELVKIQFRIILAPPYYASPFPKNETVSCLLHFDALGTIFGDSQASQITVDLEDGFYEYKRPMLESDAPIADFIYNPTIPYTSDTIIFNASESYDPDGYIVNYTWNFDDGSPIFTTSNPITTHTYILLGDYNVTLTVTDNASLTDTLSSIISVSPSHQHLYILADGSIDPPTANITSLDNVTYTFTGNVRSILYVERDNIVVDGAGYTLQGPGVYDGISLSGRSNVTIMNVKVQGCGFGINLDHSYNITLYGNEVKDNMWGLCLIESFNNTFYHNNFVDNTVQALSINSTNIWDNGYEGNYWSNYNGTDLNADGIGDTYLPWEGVDYYPLMNPYIRGDVNRDGNTDILDLKLVKLAYSGIIEHPNADLDWNGMINILDLKLMKLIYSGIL